MEEGEGRAGADCSRMTFIAGQALRAYAAHKIPRLNARSWLSGRCRAKEMARSNSSIFEKTPFESLDTSLSYAIDLARNANSEQRTSLAQVTSRPMHDAESVPKLYGIPGRLGFLTHARTVSTRPSS